MFKIILLIFLISISTHANYIQAYQLYLNGNYSETIKELKKSKKEYSDPNLHLLWGHSAKELGNLNEAMSAYERVLLLDASNIQARTALEEIYKKTNRTTLLDSANPLTKLSAYLSIALGYDDNLNARPDSEDFQDYIGDTTDVSTTPSIFTQISASLSYTDDLEEKGGWYMKYILKGFFQHNFNSIFYNLKTVAFESGIGHKTEKYNIYLPLSYHRIHYLGEDLLAQYRFNPRLYVPIGKQNIFNLNVIYSKNKYNSIRNQIRDDTTIAIEVGDYILFDKDFISAHIKYEHHTDIEGANAKYIAAKFWTLKLGAKYTFSPTLYALFDYRFRYGQYTDAVGSTATTRDDNFHQFDAKLLYKYSDKSNLFLGYTYTSNKSNYPMVVYDKNTILFGVDYTY